MGPRGFETSVQSPNRYLEIETSCISSTSQYIMRDLYNRRKKLVDWIKKVNDLDEPDKTDILKLVEHMQDKRKKYTVDCSMHGGSYCSQKANWKTF
jgi:hypothetical protein